MQVELRTSTKLSVGFGFAILLTLVLGFSGRQGMLDLTERITVVGQQRLPSVYALQEMVTGILHVAAGTRGLVHKRMMDTESRRANYEELTSGLHKASEGRKLYEKLPQSTEEARIWSNVIQRWDEWQRGIQTVLDMSREKDLLVSGGAQLTDPRVLDIDDRALVVMRRAKQLRFEMNGNLDELVRINSDAARAEVQSSEALATRNIGLMVGTMLIVALGASALAFFVSRSINRSISTLTREAGRLTEAAVAGELSCRADLASVPREFRGVVQGINDTLDALITPLNVASDYLNHISRGMIPERLTATYKGDFNTIKNNLNRCIDAVNALVADANVLVAAALDGKLSTRVDASRHEGDFQKIVDGVNMTLDAVVSPIMEATTALEALARYDLRARVKGIYNGDHARIKEALNATGEALQSALTQVADAVDQLTEASQQIAASSQSVSQGASEQASSLEETSSSLEEMAGMTKQNADNTIQARSLAHSTKEAAEKGGFAMERMTDAMGKIRSASEGTAEIIKDINEIAFQTNLLALNAAVEAARAGEAGRGFAVVAEEVRNLALRSKEAAKKTEDLIKVAVAHAENGQAITSDVAISLTEIVTAATKVNDIIGEIAVASQEQARGIEQVNQAVSEMDKAVQTAASNAEESSSAAEELAGQSEELAALVQRFELDRNRRRVQPHLASTGKDLTTSRRTALRQGAASVPRRGTVQATRGSSASHQAPAFVSAHKPTPEELIPLESDPDFRDF